MAKIASQLDTRSQDFADNRAAMQGLVEDLRSTLRRNAAGGSTAARDKHTKAGKLLARERVAALLRLDYAAQAIGPGQLRLDCDRCI